MTYVLGRYLSAIFYYGVRLLVAMLYHAIVCPFTLEPVLDILMTHVAMSRLILMKWTSVHTTTQEVACLEYQSIGLRVQFLNIGSRLVSNHHTV